VVDLHVLDQRLAAQEQLVAQRTGRGARAAHKGGVLLEHVHAEFGFLKIKKMFLKITIKTRQVFVTSIVIAPGSTPRVSGWGDLADAIAARRVSFPLRIKKHNTAAAVPSDTRVF